MITLQSTVAASRDQTSAEMQGEALILNLQDGGYYGLNEVGAFIWREIRSPALVADVCAAVLRAYDVEREQCERDVLALLADLEAHGLIDVR